MTRIIKWIFILFFLIGVLLGMLVSNSIDSDALVEQPAALTPEEIKRVKHFIKTNNPLHVKSGEIVTQVISEQDLTVLLDYLTLKTSSRLSRQIRFKISLEEQLSNVLLSVRLPETPLGEYLNITAVLLEDKAELRIKSLQISDINIPAFMLGLFSNPVNNIVEKSFPEYGLIRDSIESVKVEKDQLTVRYIWSAKAERQLKTQIGLRLITDELRRALIAHSNYLASMSYQLPKKTTLNHMMNTMFSYAKQRSEKHENNPVIENKAAFIALGAFILKRNIPEMLGEKSSKSAKFRRVYLRGRHDLSKHFILSAAITSMADSEIAESIGVVKEVRDSKNGSGFSFIDLAADHAGIRLVEEALSSEEQARRYQQILSEIKTESDYMLDVKNLPEAIAHEQFEKNYEDIGSEAYLKIEKIIKKRIDELPIYKNKPLTKINS